MFPKDTCLKLTKAEGKDVLVLTMVNVISPIAVPDGPIDLGGIKLPDEIGKYLKIAINGTDVPVTPEIFANDVSLWYDGKKHTFNSIFKENSAAGVSIPVGGKLALMLSKSAFPAAVQAMMADGKDAEIKVDVALNNPVSITHSAVLHAVAAFDPKNL